MKTKEKLKYDINDDVWFFLPSSLDLHQGHVSGYFVSVDREDDSNWHYVYQVTYHIEQKDGSQKLYIAACEEDAINPDKDELAKVFAPKRKQSIEEALKEADIEIQGSEANIKFNQERREELVKEKERLEGELKKAKKLIG